MASAASILIPLAAGVVLLAILLVIGRRGGQRTEREWRGAADDLGLIWSRSSNMELDSRVEGEIDGLQVRVSLDRLRDSTRPSRHWTVTRVETELGLDLGVGLALASRKAGGAYATKAALLPKIALDDRAFEVQIHAHARDAARAAPLLGAEARRALLAADDASTGIFVDDTAVRTQFSGVLRDRRQIVATVRAQVALVKALRAAWGR